MALADLLKERLGVENQDTWENERTPTDDEPAVLAYDVWDAQRETLHDVESSEYDVVAFLAGYGSGKSVFGARWLLAQALEHPGSRFLCMGQDHPYSDKQENRVTGN